VSVMKSRATHSKPSQPTMWCMQGPGGSLFVDTVSSYRDQSQQLMFSNMDEKFKNEHWKNWEKTLRSYRKLGIKCVKVFVAPVL
jgi:hypothetical protein